MEVRLKMSRLSNAVAEMNSDNVLRKSETVTNFMGGDSYKVDPLTRLRMVTASSIFGEPSYYRDSSISSKGKSGGSSAYVLNQMGLGSSDSSSEVVKLIREFDILGVVGKQSDTVKLMEEVIDAALDYDFGATINWAAELRNQFYIRLNPQVIMVRAAMHPKRKEFTQKHPGVFARINKQVMARADDGMSQLSYFLYTHDGKKNSIPSLLKRSWADHYSHLNRYAVAKYKNHDIGMINAVRICHAHSDVLDELMQNGTVEVSEDNKTWENLRSQGKSWEEIFKTIKMGHMALLRNLRNFLGEVSDVELIKEYLEQLKGGVATGKQFPFRYYSAYKALENCKDKLNSKMLALDTLEECIDISIGNMPKLKGRTMCLSDNSGSAWGGLTTEYGSVVVAEIDNLSSVITAMCSDEGYVGKFGDRLKIYPISKRTGALRQAREISRDRDGDVGGGTEGGIWEFFYKAIEENEHWDNIFIYSDQQAGTGGLYGTNKQKALYNKLGYGCHKGWTEYINVFKLVLDYRKKVFDRVNVFSVQTAGYDNNVMPNYAYRTNLMYGWTGKESIFADTMIKEWDAVDEAKDQKKAEKKQRLDLHKQQSGHRVHERKSKKVHKR